MVAFESEGSNEWPDYDFDESFEPIDDEPRVKIPPKAKIAVAMTAAGLLGAGMGMAIHRLHNKDVEE